MITEIKLELLQEEFIKQIEDSYTLNLSLMLLKEFAKLKQENEGLKKQLEELTNEPFTNRFSRIDSVLARIYTQNKTQQQEFIKYINSYIKLLNDKPDLVEEGQKDVLEEILSKYREIIGNDINVGSKGENKDE